MLGTEPPAVVCLDEPTRGMDRAHKDALAARLRELAAAGTAVVVATHDAEFAATLADRTVLLGDGRPVADAPTAEVLAGGWYFATQTARILGGAALLPEDGAALLRREAVPTSMSWVLASFLLLGLALTAGFAWYERSHPSAHVLALVATLAALAALGRVAFAPLPSIKPTTDIVLLTGYVLGGAPGFAVGAVAALASNLFFGQGPWTPWQMIGWGGAGLLGAGLARVAGRELGRIALAAACAVAGLLFGVVMNLSLWVTFSGDHSWAKLGLVFGTSLAFDVAHALGNVVFCLAFGPALVRALRRYRTRFEVTWRPGPAAAGVAVALAALLDRAAGARRRRPRRPRSCATWSARRTPTAGWDPRRARARPRSTRPGPRSGSPRRGAIPARSAAAAATWSTTSARTRASSGATPGSDRGRSSPCAPPGRRRGGSAAATSSPSCCGARSATARSPAG